MDISKNEAGATTHPTGVTITPPVGSSPTPAPAAEVKSVESPTATTPLVPTTPVETSSPVSEPAQTPSVPNDTANSTTPTAFEPSGGSSNMPKMLGLLLFALLVVGGLAAGGYYLGTKGMLIPQTATPAPEVTVEPSPQASATPDPTADWKDLKTSTMSIKYPVELIGCTTEKGNFETLDVRTTEECDSSGAPDNRLGFNKIVKIEDDQLYNYLKNLEVGEEKQGMTDGDRLAGVIYKRLPDSQIDGKDAMNFLYTINIDKTNTIKYSYIFNSEKVLYFVSQLYITSANNKYNKDFSKLFDQIINTFQFIVSAPKAQ